MLWYVDLKKIVPGKPEEPKKHRVVVYLDNVNGMNIETIRLKALGELERKKVEHNPSLTYFNGMQCG